MMHHRQGVWHSDRLKADRESAKAANVAREAALAFLEADANGDGILDWEEFQVAIKTMRDKDKVGDEVPLEDTQAMRELFDSIDTDKSGTIEMDEYFLWTLDIASNQGYGLEAVFRKYDQSGEGMLDAEEFAHAVEDLGFSTAFAHDLFVELDDDDSGAVSYAELTKTLRERVGDVSKGTKKFLTTLAFHDAEKWGQSQSISAQTGQRGISESISKEGAKSLVGPDDESFRQQLQSLLQHSSLRDSDLYNLLTAPLVKGEASQTLTKEVFVQGLKHLGYTGPPLMLLKLFRKIDTSGNGVIGFTELKEWMTGRMRRQTLARDVHLLWGRTDGASLSDLEWTPNGLKRELVAMLQRAELAPLDLVRAWDKSQDFSFSSREFMIMMKKIVFTSAIVDVAEAVTVAAAEKAYEAAMTELLASREDKQMAKMTTAVKKLQAIFRGRMVRAKMDRAESDKLWYDKIKPVVKDVFDECSGGDSTIDLQEFVRWLNAEWRNQRLRQKGGVEPDERPVQEQVEKGKGAKSQQASKPQVSKPQPSSTPNDESEKRLAEPTRLTLTLAEQWCGSGGYAAATPLVDPPPQYRNAVHDFQKSGKSDELRFYSSYYRALCQGELEMIQAEPPPSPSQASIRTNASNTSSRPLSPMAPSRLRPHSSPSSCVRSRSASATIRSFSRSPATRFDSNLRPMSPTHAAKGSTRKASCGTAAAISSPSRTNCDSTKRFSSLRVGAAQVSHHEQDCPSASAFQRKVDSPSRHIGHKNASQATRGEQIYQPSAICPIASPALSSASSPSVHQRYRPNAPKWLTQPPGKPSPRQVAIRGCVEGLETAVERVMKHLGALTVLQDSLEETPQHLPATDGA